LLARFLRLLARPPHVKGMCGCFGAAEVRRVPLGHRVLLLGRAVPSSRVEQLLCVLFKCAMCEIGGRRGE